VQPAKPGKAPPRAAPLASHSLRNRPQPLNSLEEHVTSIRSNKHRPKALALAVALCVAGGAQAQSTTGSIHGVAGEGATVTVSNESGLSRTVVADASGRYTIGTLPVGKYKVVVERNGEVVGSSAVTVRAGAGTDASAATSAGASTLETVTVVGSKVPSIDITAVDTRSV
jgi:hypothetical protein